MGQPSALRADDDGEYHIDVDLGIAAANAGPAAGSAVASAREDWSAVPSSHARQDDAHSSHVYEVGCQWSGSTGAGYEVYDRTHTVQSGRARSSCRREEMSSFR
jgi:hypothetical protein